MAERLAVCEVGVAPPCASEGGDVKVLKIWWQFVANRGRKGFESETRRRLVCWFAHVGLGSAYSTLIRSSTTCTPGADQAARSAAARSWRACTLPSSVTLPPITP